ncbi:hypothetical protein HUG17_8436 [Dermatophagoides farinae]|uniref:Uncharacterized protein n=1 Tax=Dermatophagoides farinae TaxID=6954 RepID=A0A9D4NZ83_DERFA|nr:hypothetical protein HUG17_8436 [Dermatophagoides farinae]
MWMGINTLLLLVTVIIRLAMKLRSRQIFEILMNDPHRAMKIVARNEKPDFYIDRLFNRIIMLSSFYIIVGVVGLFAYYRRQTMELLHQFSSIFSMVITIYLLDPIMSEQIYLQRRFITSLRYVIIGHNFNDGLSSYWLQMAQNLLNCCGSNNPEKQFNRNNIPLTCCESLTESKIEKWKMNKIVKCHIKDDAGADGSGKKRLKKKRLNLKKPCISSIYYHVLTNVFWTWLSMNVILQLFIVNLVFVFIVDDIFELIN